MIDNEVLGKCQKAAVEIRKDIIRMTYNAGNTGAHIGGSLSIVEIMAVLHLGIMRYDVTNPYMEERDRFILSKGHGVMAQYAALKQLGLISQEELLTFKKNETHLFAHPSLDLKRGIEFSSGSLGQGLSFGVGTALALKRKGNFSSRVFVLLGDGECDEGSVWEAASSASHYKLDNLTAIVDENQLQYDGATSEVLSKDNLLTRWHSFGWSAVHVNGHSIEELLNELSVRGNKPTVIIARTVKGKGVSFMEDMQQWHNGRLSQKQFEEAMAEQEVIQ